MRQYNLDELMVRYAYEADMRHTGHKCLRPAIHAIMDIQHREFGAAEEKVPLQHGQ